MKRYLYSLCFVVALTSLSACNKSSDPAPVSPVVGRWELQRGLLSGFASPNTNLNGESIDLYFFEDYGSTLDIYSDNTFNANFKRYFTDDSPGTWTFADQTLTLKYDSGDSETYTYAKTKNIEELTNTKPISYTLPVSSTATAGGQLSFVYRK